MDVLVTYGIDLVVWIDRRLRCEVFGHAWKTYPVHGRDTTVDLCLQCNWLNERAAAPAESGAGGGG